MSLTFPTPESVNIPALRQLEERHLDSVQAMLERTYGISGDDLATAHPGRWETGRGILDMASAGLLLHR